MSLPDVLESAFGLNRPQKYYGKYRGTVVNNIDPLRKGRIMAMVPDVSAVIPTTWAMPCVPIAGIQTGIYVVPPVGAGVWVEFEQGDPNYPIWSGGWWGSAAEIPALAQTGVPASPSIVLQTLGQSTIMISDTPGPAGGILLKTRSGAFISINDLGIAISNGKGATIVMQSGNMILMNAGALTVT